MSRVCADARLRSAARASARAARVSLVVSQAAIHVSELNYQQASGAHILKEIGVQCQHECMRAGGHFPQVRTL